MHAWFLGEGKELQCPIPWWDLHAALIKRGTGGWVTEDS